MFTKDQVGSSTMPQKRNPWNSEHVKSLWKTFSPRVMTFFMDQISEHQRDLTNSASQRFITEYISGFAAAVGRLNKVVTTLKVHKEKMKENIEKTGGMILAEAVYILISLSGEKEGHELVRKLTLEAEKNELPLIDVLKSDYKLWKKITEQLETNINRKPEELFGSPEMYSGIASKKALKIADKYKKLMKTVKSRL
jgi:adenylosuccinate lyase